MTSDVSMCYVLSEFPNFLKLFFVRVHFWIFWMKRLEIHEIDLI